MTTANETQILRLTVEALLTISPSVQLCYEDDGEPALHITSETPFDQVTEEAFACDMMTLRVGQKWVTFIWDHVEEGLSCISDHGTSLTEVLKPVFDWIDRKEAEL